MTAATEVRLIAPTVAGLGATPDAGAKAWSGVRSMVIPLSPTPLDRQPSAYVQASWRERPYGAVAAMEAQFAVNAGMLHARLIWVAADPRPAITDNNVFPDACALLFPSNGSSAPLETMGSPEEPVTTWHWRAGAPGAFLATASGLGTVDRTKSHDLAVEAAWANGRWTVAFACPIGSGGFAIPEKREVSVAFAAWSGANNERAGLKSHSPAWSTLSIS